MKYTQPALPYTLDAFEPILSSEAMDYHYNKHHAAYYNKLNQLIDASNNEKLQSMSSLQEIIQNTAYIPGAINQSQHWNWNLEVHESWEPIFNNAAQAWNHDFYWQCLTQDSAARILPENLKAALCQSFGSVEHFKEQFMAAANAQFGSGWAWLVKDSEGQLKIQTTSNADTPMRLGVTCLLTCDVWEHAYYIDYRNRRPDYVTAFWDIINWKFVEKNFSELT